MDEATRRALLDDPALFIVTYFPDSIKRLEDDRADTRERFARIEAKLDAVKDATEETKEFMRQIAAGRK